MLQKLSTVQDTKNIGGWSSKQTEKTPPAGGRDGPPPLASLHQPIRPGRHPGRVAFNCFVSWMLPTFHALTVKCLNFASKVCLHILFQTRLRPYSYPSSIATEENARKIR